MESLPQGAAALQHVLTRVAETAASEVGFVRRRRRLTGASFVQALVLGWLACPAATLHQLTQRLAVRETSVSPQGLAQRFTPAAAALLERVLAAAVATAVTAAGATAGGQAEPALRGVMCWIARRCGCPTPWRRSGRAVGVGCRRARQRP